MSVMNYVSNGKDFSKALESAIEDTKKKIRFAAYRTLEQVAERSRNAIIANYTKKFPDQNGVVKNKGVPKCDF